MRLLGESDEPPPALFDPAPLVHAARHTAPLAALDFTQSGDGLLIADAAGGIAMYAIPDHRSAASGSADDSAGASKGIMGAAGSLTGMSRGAVGGLSAGNGEASGAAWGHLGASKASPDSGCNNNNLFRGPLEQAWAGRGSTVTAPQTLISAGAHCWAPAATGQPGGNNVTVWWPPEAPAKAPKEPGISEGEPLAQQGNLDLLRPHSSPMI